MKLRSFNTYLCRWTAVAWPQRIISQVEATTVQHEEDEERFHKIQLSDQDNFGEHLDALKVSGGSSEFWLQSNYLRCQLRPVVLSV